MTARRGAIRGELLHFLGAEPDGTPSNLPDPLPPYEEGSNRLYELLSRSSEFALSTNKATEDSHTIYELLPLLLLRILGYRPGSGWLETGSDLSHRDREALLRLILPHGPIHNFCRRHEPTKGDASFSPDSDFLYEFPVSNLPPITRSSLDNAAYSTSPGLAGMSALAPLLSGAVRTSNSAVLYLTPMQYLELCLVSSAVHKWTEWPRTSSGQRRTQKRSSSLPSVRAMYNQVIYSYAELVRVNETFGTSLLVAACIDQYCLPWANATGSEDMPRVSTPCVDALSSVLLALAPKDESESSARPSVRTPNSWSKLSNAGALYWAVDAMLMGVFQKYSTNNPTTTLAAHLRLLALFIAPWKRSIRTTMHIGLFPKQRGAPASKRTTMKSAINSISEQIKYHSGVSPSKLEPVAPEKHRAWRSSAIGDLQHAHGKLILHCIIRAANLRLGNAADGLRALSLVAEAVSAAGVRYTESDFAHSADVRPQSRLEEAKGCLKALRDQSMELENKLGIKTRSTLSSLSLCLGVRLENAGLFSEMAERMAVVTSHSPSKSTATPRFVQRRKSLLMKRALVDDVHFIGSVWDQPITESENEFLMTMAYWMSLKIESLTGLQVNTRFLARFSTWLQIGVLVLLVSSISMLFRALL